MSRKAAYILICVVLIHSACTSGSKPTTEYIHLQGRTMGTTYSISYASQGFDYQEDIDSLLEEVNLALSTYIPESVISTFNATGETKLNELSLAEAEEQDPLLYHFEKNLDVADTINDASSGAFDPTVGPLVNLWGFGWEGRAPSQPDSMQIDSMLALVGMHHIVGLNEGNKRMIKTDIPGVKLDFSALAKGYGVDVVALFLTSKNVEDFFVEIGGEVRTGGLSPRGDKWRIGINQPDPDADVSALYTRVSISNKSMATSGNYRNYYFVDGIRVWHTINPGTGYPERNPLLSATIVHERCIIADALATACMVMGPEEGLQMILDYAGAEAFILYNSPEGAIKELMTPGFREFLIDTK